MFGIVGDAVNEGHLRISLVASTLASDFEDPESTLHAKRELTGCGQGGSELSGGQQARVAMARCIYAALHGKTHSWVIRPLPSCDTLRGVRC